MKRIFELTYCALIIVMDLSLFVMDYIMFNHFYNTHNVSGIIFSIFVGISLIVLNYID